MGDELHLDSKAAICWALLHSCIFRQQHSLKMEARNNSPASSIPEAPAPAPPWVFPRDWCFPGDCWPSGRSGRVQHPSESWNSLLKGMKSFPLCLQPMLQINPAHPTQGQQLKRAWNDPNYDIRLLCLPCPAINSCVDGTAKLAGPKCAPRCLGQPRCRYSPSSSSRMQARSPEAVGGVYVKACRQHVLITKQGHYAILLS